MDLEGENERERDDLRDVNLDRGEFVVWWWQFLIDAVEREGREKSCLQ